MPSNSRYEHNTVLSLISSLCFLALGVALISQYEFDIQPCAWCVLQRLIYLVIGVVALIGSFAGPIGSELGRLVALLSALLSAAGIATAWYQYSVASRLMSCAQTFADRFMGALGLDAAAPWLFGIYATCAEARVKLLGVEYALWSLALFVVLLLLALAALFARRR